MTRRVFRGMACLSLLAACGDSSHSPSSPTSPSRGASVFAGTLLSVKIVGPSVVQPGTSTQFTATATFSDGSATDVTSAAVWRTSNASVFVVTAPGLVQSTAVGAGTITISYQNRGAALSLYSLPADTGILSGHVTQSGFSIDGVKIEVVGGPFAGKTATTSTSGSYTLYGVGGVIQIRASKDGYVAVTKTVTVAPFTPPGPNAVLDFELSLVNPLASLAGTYRVTLSASPSCAGRLLPDALVRNYSATIAQDGARLTVTLGDATFAGSSSPTGPPANKFTGQMLPASIQFTVGTTSSFYYYYYYYVTAPGIVEKLVHPPVGAWGFSQNEYFAVTGSSTTPITSSILSSAFNGTLSIMGTSGTGFKTSMSCTASDHRLTMIRQ